MTGIRPGGRARCVLGGNRGDESAVGPGAMTARGDLPYTWTLEVESTSANRMAGRLLDAPFHSVGGLYPYPENLSSRERRSIDRGIGPPEDHSERFSIG